MKIPVIPPILPDITQFDWNDPDTPHKVSLIFDSSIGPTDKKGRYLHWDKLRHLNPPQGYTPELYWHAIHQARTRISKPLPFKDKHGNPFTFCLPDSVIKDMLWISENATGAIKADGKVDDNNTRQTYLINTLIEEAISSSQLEGASTTRRVAKEMIRSGRAPKSHSEKMIYNNYHAMTFIREMKHEDLTPSMVFELHRILTYDTLEERDKNKAGTFRDKSDDICVFSLEDELLHIPPNAKELPKRLQLLCDFVNSRDTEKDYGVYIPAILKAIIVHFMLGYDHPFVDGNGRTARALFYWIMSREKFWLMEYLSISRIIKKAPAQYMQAFLYTETDDNDMTYFITHQMDVIRKAINDLHQYLDEKVRQQRETEHILEKSRLKGLLNHRQTSLLYHALKNPGTEYTIKGHKNSHGVVYQTARNDLLDLSEQYGLLRKFKSKKTDVFIAPAELEKLIMKYK